MNKQKLIILCEKAAEMAVSLAAFSFAGSSALTNIFLGLSIFFFLFKRILKKDFSIPQNPLNIFFVLLFASCLLSMLNTIELDSSIGGLLRLFYCFMFFLAIVDTVNDEIKLKRVVLALLCGLLLISIDGIFQYFTGKDLIRGRPPAEGDSWKIAYGTAVPRLSASMKFSNVFACYLATVIPLALCLALYFFKGVKRLIFSLLCLLPLFCMFNTFFRGAALAFVAVIVLFCAIKKDIRLGIGFLLLAAIALFFLPKPILKWGITHPNPIDFFIEEGGRRWHWQAALNMIKHHPFVGVGIKTFLNNYAQYKIPSDPMTGFNAHGSYLQLTAETGFIGLSVFMALICAVIMSWRKAYARIKAPGLQAISLGLFGCFIGFLTVSILDSFLQSSPMTVLFYFILGLLMAVNIIAAQPAEG